MENNYLGFLGREGKQKNVKEEQSRIDYYKMLKDTDDYIREFRFSRCDFDKGLVGFDEDVEIFLPVNELMHERPNKQSYVTFTNLDRVYTLKIIDIDDEAKRVTVSFFEAQKKFREEEIKNIDDALIAGEHPVRKGTVYALMRDELKGIRTACIVDILGLGIYASMSIRDWSTLYTPDLSEVTKQGDIVEVAITGKSTRKGMAVYQCSRREVADENVEDFNRKFPAGTGVTIKCISRGDSFFRAQIVGYKNAFCECRYPRERKIEVGKYYAGFVRDTRPGRAIRVHVGFEL